MVTGVCVGGVRGGGVGGDASHPGLLAELRATMAMQATVLLSSVPRPTPMAPCKPAHQRASLVHGERKASDLHAHSETNKQKGNTSTATLKKQQNGLTYTSKNVDIQWGVRPGAALGLPTRSAAKYCYPCLAHLPYLWRGKVLLRHAP